MCQRHTPRLARGLSMLLLTTSAFGQTVEIEHIVRVGDEAPGLSPSALFEDIGSGPTYADGRVVFKARAGSTYGIWAGAPGELFLVAAGDQPAPGTEPGTVFANNSYNFRKFAAAGENLVAFWAQLDGDSVDDDNDTSFWIFNDGEHHLLLREGDPVPNLAPGTTFANISHNYFRNVMSDAGTVFIGAAIEGPGVNSSNDGILYAGHADGTLTQVYREGDQAPGSDLAIVGDYGLLMNGNDILASTLRLGPDSLPTVYVGPLDDLRPVMQLGDALPGFEGLEMISLDTAGFNNAATLLLKTTFQDPDTSAYSHALWRRLPDGSLTLLARSGDPAPGIDADVYFFAFSYVAMDAEGRLALAASITGDVTSIDSSAFWTVSPAGDWEFVLRSNDSLPGFAEPLIFNSSEVRAVIDNQGLAVFRVDADFANVLVGRRSDLGTFGILPPGEVIELDPWKSVTIGWAGADSFPAGSQDGLATALSADGQLALGFWGDAVCKADLNADGVTDQSDLGILLHYYDNDVYGDLDGDDDTDQSDLGILLADYGCVGGIVDGFIRVRITE